MNIEILNYNGMEIEVHPKIAQYLESDRKFIQAQERRDRRHTTSIEMFNEKIENVMFIKSSGFEDMVIKTDELKQLNNALSVLDSKELNILKKRFYQNISLVDIAGEQGVSYQAIQKKINIMISKLRKEF